MAEACVLSNAPVSGTRCKVAAFYTFVFIDDVQAECDFIKTICNKYSIFGGIIVASEGINGTISGKSENIDGLFIEILQKRPRFNGINSNLKYSLAEDIPFYRLRVTAKSEIITMGCPDINPAQMSGKYVDPQDWNALISDPTVILVDTRNSYEIDIGTFPRAIDPAMESFRDFPDFVSSKLNDKNVKVAMWCTGGIRCEKASAYMLHQGFKDVCHLKGGVLKYLEEVAPEQSLWQGECYVFDQRVSVKHGLGQGNYTLCRACRHTLFIGMETFNDTLYIEGISCRYCHDKAGKTRERAKARQRQILLANHDTRKHLGAMAEGRRNVK